MAELIVMKILPLLLLFTSLEPRNAFILSDPGNHYDDSLFKHHPDEDPLLVETTSGLVRGLSQTLSTGHEVHAFMGIPYAQSPVGDLRFKKPVPIDPWSGILDAQSLPNSCQQEPFETYPPDFRGEAMWNPNTPISEDCLYLNLWVPASHRSSSSKMAVLIWIHGGGFFSGTSSLDIYDGRILAGSNNVIVASFNYRLGPFGFLYLGNEEAPGNAGMYDQVLAIEWIKSNIASFGGDPDSLTLFGESAGAESVNLHLMSPVSRPLFNRAVLQSGSANTPWIKMTTEAATKLALALVDDVGCNAAHLEYDAAGVMECMRNVEARNLTIAQFNHRSKMRGAFGPVVDGAFLTENPVDIIQGGNFPAADILVGSNLDEGSYFLLADFPQHFDKDVATAISHATFLEVIDSVFEDSFTSLERQIIAFQYSEWDRFVNESGSEVKTKMLSDLLGDYLWTCPLNYLGQKWAESGNNVFYYYFTQRSSSNPWGEWMGVLHGDEIEYIFGQPFNPAWEFTESERELSRRMMNYLTSFAITGKPTETDESWPKYSRQEPYYMILNADLPEGSIGYGPRGKACAFWNDFMPSMKDKCATPVSLQHTHSFFP